MPLIESLPINLENTLNATPDGDGAMVIAIATDFSLDGAYGEEWLVVTQNRLRIYACSPRSSGGAVSQNGHPVNDKSSDE